MVHVALAGLTHDPARSLADRLVSLTPDSLQKVFFSDNGSTSVEVALKICLQYWRLTGDTSRRLLVGFDRGYHGDTLGCMAVGGSRTFHERFEPWFPPSLRLPSPADGGSCLEALDDLLETRGHEIAAVVIEPLLQAAGGMWPHSPETLDAILERVQGMGIPVVADEVATGLGRTGTFWAIDQISRTPDFLCVSKSLTGGMLPLAATLVREEMVEVFKERDDGLDRTFYHGHTYTGHALACSVAHASLDLVTDDSFLPHVRELTRMVSDGLKLFEGLAPGLSVDQVGTVGVVRTGLPGRRPLLPVYRSLLEDGVYLRPLGDIMYFWPPLTITPEEYAQLMSRARDHLAALFTREASA